MKTRCHLWFTGMLALGTLHAGCAHDWEPYEPGAAPTLQEQIDSCKRHCPGDCDGPLCEHDCDAGGCTMTCDGDHDCEYDCASGGCDMICNTTGTCDFSCPVGGCNFICGANDCTTSCALGGCTWK